MFRYWSLERKSLLFIGLALLVSICISYAFFQHEAEKLVMASRHQKASDFAKKTIAWTHAEVQGTRRDTTNQQFPSATLSALRASLIEEPNYRAKLLMLSSKPEFDLLWEAVEPSTKEERRLLDGLLQKFNSAQKDADERPAVSVDGGEAVPSTEEPSRYARNKPELSRLFETVGPVYEPDAPEGGYFVYYHPVYFSASCMGCHVPLASTADSTDTPFRVMKVSMPYADGQVMSGRAMAVMIAVGMVTLSVSILILHFILRKLVIQPLRHLRNVSDEISRGKYDLRASIDTDDEFSELAEAFNRMLRHLTESQEKLQELNSQLDGKVDELARANLYLYEANRLKSDFMANMSHELRTPLNSIIGFSDVLYDISSLTDKQKRYASNIQKSGRMLLEMINDILDLAKVEAGKMKVGPTMFDLGNVAQAQCDMLRSLVEEKNMELRVIVSPDLTPVFQDQPKIQQILTNLLSNAIKFTPDGGLITLTIGCVGEDLFHMTVADTGVGIPESDFEVIFEKFRQSNSIVQGRGLTREYSGTGLGLSIVKELCKLLGGEIKLSSQLGTGSTFHVIMPRHYTPEQIAELTNDLAATI